MDVNQQKISANGTRRQSSGGTRSDRPLHLLPLRLVRRQLAVIDDDQAIQLYLKETLGQLDFSIQCFDSAEAFLEFLNLDAFAKVKKPLEQPFDVILCDVKLPGLDGLSLVQFLRKMATDVPIVLMTAYAQIESAVEAIKEGAYDYLEKPFNLDRLTLVIENAMNVRALNVENTLLRSPGSTALSLQGVVCQSPAMLAVYDLVKRVAPTDSSVLITGENGVGKELIARALHDNSLRSDGPFVSINCSAIPDSLLESELFGHQTGAFGSDAQHRKGLFEDAEGGTLFLDEIGELNFALQAKLLRVLQEKKVRAVGDNELRAIDVRIVTATHKNLISEVKHERFREDLYYRLNVIQVHIPPLRQRRDDVVLLSRYFLDELAKKTNSPAKSLTPDALSKLVNLPWKGNVRELQNVIERSVVLTPTLEIDAADIPVVEDREIEDFLGEFDDEFPSLRDLEKRYLLSVLRKLDGKKEEAAKVLGMSRRTLYRKLENTDPDRDSPKGN